ncbi:MAG TPA: hypothetical protein VG122_20545 [Gemmata sp.]|jgi:hypothetical protein|nr:hypothetical protein [Gemmata sp.]
MERVAWVPGWYELDPPLEVGLSGEFAFWRVVPDHLRGPEPLALYNTLWQPKDAIVARGMIVAIWHPELGKIRKLDTRGLDYTITLEDGTELMVNAEEEPGRLFDRVGVQWIESSRIVSNWRFVVEFESLSEPGLAESVPTGDGGG